MLYQSNMATVFKDVTLIHTKSFLLVVDPARPQVSNVQMYYYPDISSIYIYNVQMVERFA